MKTMEKIDTNCKGFHGWTHYYEDGPMILNESLDGTIIVQLAIIIENDKLQFNYKILDKDYNSLYEFINDTLNLGYINSRLKELGNYYLELESETFSWLLCVEHI